MKKKTKQVEQKVKNEKLYAIIESKGYTHIELATKLGCSLGGLDKWLSGGRTPGEQWKAKIEKLYAKI